MSEFKRFVTRLENAVFQEAEAEFRDLSFTAARRRAEAVNEARQNLMAAIERLENPMDSEKRLGELNER